MNRATTKGDVIISFRPSLKTQSLLDKYIEDLKKATDGIKPNRSAVIDRLLNKQLATTPNN